MAYFSNQGAPIHAGAAGLGDAGQLMSFRDGSLGQNGNLMSFRDGSLGKYGDLMSFRDGSLGGCRSCGGLGEVAASAVLDMNDPDTVLQVKSLMAFIGGPTTNTGHEATLTSPVWDEAARNYAGIWIIAVGGASATPAGVVSPQAGGDPLPMFAATGIATNGFFEGPLLHPNPTGIIAMMQIAAQGGLTTEEATRTVPKLVGFISATQGDPSTGRVVAPGVSAQDDGIKPAYLALGAVAVLGVVLLATGKKKRS